MTVMATDAPQRYLQGIPVPAESVDPAQFFARTRRHITREVLKGFAGNGLSDTIEVRKADILSQLIVRFTGSLVVTTPSGTCTPTARWPYDWATFKFTANGQSNIINARGGKLKVREIMKDESLNDRGVVNTFNGVSRVQGTLAKSSESWGAFPLTAVAAGTYPVELEWVIPVAEDQEDLAGAIFAATSATDLTLNIDWDSISNVFTLTSGATATLTGNVQVSSTKFAIPVGPNGQMVLPELDTFHSIIQARDTSVANGDNETRVIGQGAGRSLLRTFFQVMSGGSPLSMNATNFGRLGWRYGGNETPDEYQDGQHLRLVNEADYNSDIGVLWGFGCHDFAASNAFRDVVNMGTVSELRLLYNIPNAVTLTTPAIEYCVETVYAAGQGS